MRDSNFSDAMYVRNGANLLVPIAGVGSNLSGVGTVLLVDSPGRRMLTWLCVALGLGILYVFMAVETTRKVHCVGSVVSSAGVINVVSMHAGVVVTRRVDEGQLVVAGQPLFVVSGERVSRRIGAAVQMTALLLKGRLDALGAELGLVERQVRDKENALHRRADQLREEAARIDQQLAWQHERIRLSQAGLLRLHELEAGRFVSTAQLQIRRGDLLDQCQRLAELQRAKMALKRELADIGADVSNLQLQAQRDQHSLQSHIDTLKQEIAETEARREWMVLAEREGVVTAISAEPGQNVGAAQVMALIVPQDAPLQAEVFVPSRSIGFVRRGMQVWLRLHAFPFQKFGQFGATVDTITEAALDMRQGGEPTSQRTEPMYRIRLKLAQQSVVAAGQQLPLRPGMQLDASIVQDRRFLYEWIVTPLFGAT